MAKTLSVYIKFKSVTRINHKLLCMRGTSEQTPKNILLSLCRESVLKKRPQFLVPEKLSELMDCKTEKELEQKLGLAKEVYNSCIRQVSNTEVRIL